MAKADLISQVIVEPSQAVRFDLEQWELLVRQGKHAFLLAKLYHKFCEAELETEILAPAKHHFLSADMIAQRQRIAVPLEVERVRALLAQLDLDLVLLKGAAYAVSGLPAANGRTFSDIDILVPANKLDALERVFKDDGWIGQHMDAYDQKYYRQWMHEIPPLQHFRRGTEVDMHHTILPPTANYHPDPMKLLEKAVRVAPGIKVLCPEDMVIHSATHLFHEGEFEHGLRDLVDIAELLIHFGKKNPDFWVRLVPRAIELELIRPLYYGLHYARKILSVPIPNQVMAEVALGAPNPVMGKIMDWLFLRALRPNHPSCDLFGAGLARWFLYVRSHYLRMPLYLLLPHLVRKAWKARFEKKAEGIPAFIPGEQKK
ncbi:MAG: nucleotidyltransferase family protein [Pseudomonadales bacterium]|nr:nucleotidyltransferase family protein [Pseudomonadales bacterium]